MKDFISIYKKEFYNLVLQSKIKISQGEFNNIFMIYQANLLFKIAAPVKRIHDIDRGHFDIKPANYLYTNLFQVVLSDLHSLMTLK